MNALELLKVLKEEYNRDCEMNFSYQVPSNEYMLGEYNMLRIAEKFVNNEIDKMAKEEN